MTLRAIVIGLVAVLIVAVVAPINDWVLKNTFIYNHYLPLGVTMLVLALGLVVNPLLGRHRLRTGEMVVVVSMLLALGGVVSSGLTRLFPGVMAGAAKALPATPYLAPLMNPDGTVLPARMFVGLEAGQAPNPDDPEHRYVVDGFFNGLGRSAPSVRHRATVTWQDATGQTHTAVALSGASVATTPGCLDLDREPGRFLAGHRPGESVTTPGGELRVVAVTSPGVPWYAWVGPFLNWLPLLGGAFICCLAIAALVRRQWIEHERLPYPIATLTLGFLAEPAPGSRFAAIFSQRGFWIGFAIATVVLASQGLQTWGFTPIAITTTFDFRGSFNGDPWWQVYTHWWLFRVHLFFSIVGLTFFLPLDLSFSMWFFYLLTNLVYLVLHLQGVPVGYDHAAKAGVGGFAVECLLILWIGRLYYYRLVKAALVGSADPATRAVTPYVWILLAGFLAMVLWLVGLGCQPAHAVLVTLLFLGFCLVMARIVAEAGIPYIGIPNGCYLSQVTFSLIGFNAPLAVLAPLTLLGATLLGDSRENLLPYAVHCEFLAHQAIPRPTRGRRLRFTLILLGAVLIGMVVSGATLMVACYGGSGQPDANWYYTLVDQGLGPLANGWTAGADDRQFADNWMCYGIGAGLVAILGVCRMFIAAWPLHPIGYLVSMTYSTQTIWFSFLLGWLAKMLVMRYGGALSYQRLKPVAVGLIAGEAVAAGAFLIAAIVLHFVGIDFIDHPNFLPG
jgi:hypothetical protein